MCRAVNLEVVLFFSIFILNNHLLTTFSTNNNISTTTPPPPKRQQIPQPRHLHHNATKFTTTASLQTKRTTQQLPPRYSGTKTGLTVGAGPSERVNKSDGYKKYAPKKNNPITPRIFPPRAEKGGANAPDPIKGPHWNAEKASWQLS